jgi:cytidylate kinase
LTYLPRLRELEQRLLKEHGLPKKPIITIGGWSGTGKDTAAYNLQKLLAKDGIRLDVFVAGDIFRAAARKAGFSERELEKFSASLKSEDLDIKVDNELLEQALTKGGIFVGRLAPAVVGEHGIKIWIETDAKVIAERISNDKERKEYGMPTAELAKRIAERNEVDAVRYKKIYGIDPEKLKTKYDLVLNNSKLTKEQAAKKLYDFVRPRFKAFK